MKPNNTRVSAYFFLVSVMAAWPLSSCYSPSHSQQYFIKASADDPALDPIYTTSIYTVYYDHALLRCVLHSAHTWGQNGGGGGGTGIGVYAFRCDPNHIRERAESLGMETLEPKTRFPEGTPQRGRRAPVSPGHERTMRRSQTPSAAPSAPPPASPPPERGPSGSSPGRSGNPPIIRGVE